MKYSYSAKKAYRLDQNFDLEAQMRTWQSCEYRKVWWQVGRAPLNSHPEEAMPAMSFWGVQGGQGMVKSLRICLVLCPRVLCSKLRSKHGCPQQTRFGWPRGGRKMQFKHQSYPSEPLWDTISEQTVIPLLRSARVCWLLDSFRRNSKSNKSANTQAERTFYLSEPWWGIRVPQAHPLILWKGSTAPYAF